MNSSRSGALRCRPCAQHADICASPQRPCACDALAPTEFVTPTRTPASTPTSATLRRQTPTHSVFINQWHHLPVRSSTPTLAPTLTRNGPHPYHNLRWSPTVRRVHSSGIGWHCVGPMGSPHPASRRTGVRQRAQADGREGCLVVVDQLLQRLVAARCVRQVLPAEDAFSTLSDVHLLDNN